MTPEPLNCPYCNAHVPVPAADEARARATCPRCGETFPYRPADETAAAPGPSLTANGTSTAPRLLRAVPTHYAVQIAVHSGVVVLASLALRAAFPEYATARQAFPFMFLLGAVGAVASVWLWYFQRPRSNAATAAFFLGNMGLVALIALPYALLTQDFRRSHDPPRKSEVGQGGPGSEGKAGEGHSPAKLPALGYLPTDSNLVVGVHMAELLREPAGKELLEQPSWGPLRMSLGQVEKWTGLKKDAIDHVVVGVRTEGLPRLTVVIQTRVAYDPHSFRVLLEDSRPMEHHGRLLYPLQLRPVGQGALWCVADRTLLLTLWWDATGFPRMKEALPRKPRQGDEGLPAAIRECLQKRLPRGALVWTAGTSVPPPVVAAVLPFARGLKAAPELLKTVRVFDAALRFDSGAEEIGLVGDVECADVKSAAALQLLMQEQKVTGIGTPKVVGPADRPNKQGQEAERWVSFQLRARPRVLREALRSEGGLLPWLGER